MTIDPHKILIVEDEAITALDLEGILEDLGFSVLDTADSAKSAIEALGSSTPDLILMDIKIKGDVDGIDLAKLVRSKYPTIPIIFITSFSDEHTLSRAAEINPNGYIIKPFDVDEIKKSVFLALKSENQNVQTVRTSCDNPSLKGAEFDDGNRSFTPLEFIKRNFAIKGITDSQYETVAQSADFAVFEEGQSLFKTGEIPEYAFIVADGRVNCVQPASKGKELTTRILVPGDSFFISLCIQNEPLNYDVVAARKSFVLRVKTSEISNLATVNSNVYKFVVDDLMEQMRRMEQLAKLLAFEKVDVRIAHAILRLARLYGQFDRENNSTAIDATRQELAMFAGTTSETTIRVTRKFEEKGVLNLRQAGTIMIIDSDELERLSAC